MIVFNQTGKGTYWRAYHFARELVSRGHKVTLLSTSQKLRRKFIIQDIEGIHLVESPDTFMGSLRSGYDPWNVINRLNWLQSKEFDIVHGFETRPVVIYPAMKAKKYHAALFLDWADWFGRGGSVEERPNSLVRNILGWVESYYEQHYRDEALGTTVINSFLRNKAIEFGVAADKVLLLRNGSDTRSPVLDKDQARRQLGIQQDGPLIGFVGGTYSNDAQLMADAFNLVLKKFPKAQLVLAGYFNRDIESLLDAPQAVIRSGPITSQQVHLYLSCCDLCWLPLIQSGANIGRWPFKLNDYMTAGRPTVSTDVGDLAIVIPEYNLGSITKSNPEAFAAGTINLLESPDQVESLGKSARTAAENQFEWRIITQELENFYFQMLSNQF
jgi:glycosyltransferase involved in cell wall biosynthesis